MESCWVTKKDKNLNEGLKRLERASKVFVGKGQPNLGRPERFSE